MKTANDPRLLPADWTTAHYADGPAVAEWFIRHGLVDGEPKSALARRVYAWSRGERPSLACVDRWLTLKGYHLSELPDEVWLRDPIADRIEGGVPIRQIAREFGLAPDTIRWRRQKLGLAS